MVLRYRVHGEEKECHVGVPKVYSGPGNLSTEAWEHVFLPFPESSSAHMLLMNLYRASNEPTPMAALAPPTTTASSLIGNINSKFSQYAVPFRVRRIGLRGVFMLHSEKLVAIVPDPPPEELLRRPEL